MCEKALGKKPNVKPVRGIFFEDAKAILKRSPNIDAVMVGAKLVPIDTDIVVLKRNDTILPRIEFSMRRELEEDWRIKHCMYNLVLPSNVSGFGERLARLKKKKQGRLAKSLPAFAGPEDWNSEDFVKEYLKQEGLYRDQERVFRRLSEITKRLNWKWRSEAQDERHLEKLRFAYIETSYSDFACDDAKLAKNHDYSSNYAAGVVRTLLEDIGTRLRMEFEPKEGVEVRKLSEDVEHLFKPRFSTIARSQLWIKAHRKA